jgi:hypothetical protein
MPLQATSGAASYDAFGGGAAAVPQYIEDVFSTYLYTGNGSTQTITNGIDLSTKGGLVWTKKRVDQAAFEDHCFQDTARGVGLTAIFSNSTSGANGTYKGAIQSFGTTGYSLYNADQSGGLEGTWQNYSAGSYVSWSFRKQPKFFDVVTYTGTGSAGLTVSHNLGSVPACIMVKCTDSATDWNVYHTSLGNTKRLFLNTTAAAQTTSAGWNNTSPTSTEFTLGASGQVNGAGSTYVAYLFAHDAGGFGLTGTDNVISCGSVDTGASGTSGTANLGWEPQFVIIKRINGVENWMQFDNMRGLGVLYAANKLNPNSTNAEGGVGADEIQISSTGLTIANVGNNAQFIYIAIRRGPMAVPTTGASVFVPYAYTGNGSATRNYSAIGIVTDMNWTSCRSTNVGVSPLASTRLQGNTTRLQIANSGAEASGTYGLTWNAYQNGVQGNSVYAPGDGWNSNTYTYIGWNFRRAPKFFDEVCYTGNGANPATISHNLTVAPEIVFFKSRSATNSWDVVYNNTTYITLTSTSASGYSDTSINGTATTFDAYAGAGNGFNASGVTYVAYLFATCAGVSKVGSYTGTGALQTVNCGFTGGARFVLIKRTDTDTATWYVWDSARGITSGNDPYLLLNSTATEVTGTNYVDTDSTGFKVTAAAPSGLNASGGTFIFLAIA